MTVSPFLLLQVVSAATGKTSTHCATLTADGDAATLLFSADAGPGDYLVYYLPFRTCEFASGACTYNAVATYDTPSHCRDPSSWVNTTHTALAKNTTVCPLSEGRSPFDAFTPEELRATATECAAWWGAAGAVLPGGALVAAAVVGDNGRGIALAPGIPAAWAQRPPSQLRTYVTALAPGERHTLVVGVAALSGPLLVRGYTVAPSLPSGWLVTCFNLEGTSAGGEAWTRNVASVPANWTLPLWFGKAE